jgi:hypothetical protein
MADADLRAEILAIFHRLPNRADELNAIFSKHGVEGGRLALGNIAIAMANDVADRLNELADRFKTEAEKAVTHSINGSPSKMKLH